MYPALHLCNDTSQVPPADGKQDLDQKQLSTTQDKNELLDLGEESHHFYDVWLVQLFF